MVVLQQLTPCIGDVQVGLMKRTSSRRKVDVTLFARLPFFECVVGRCTASASVCIVRETEERCLFSCGEVVIKTEE